MTVSLGGRLCCDPVPILEFCAGHNVPAGRWAGIVNDFSNVLGVRSGVGHVLMRRVDLDALNFNALHDLTISSTAVNSVTHKNLVIAGVPECVLPGTRGDPNAPYLVELADRRRVYHAIPIDAAYNVPQIPGAATYFSATENSGSPWTWETMVEDVWDTVDALGTYPGLPFAPDGQPTGFNFYGWASALEALGVVLERLSCALKLDTLTDTFSIVRIAAADAVLTKQLTTLDSSRVWDADFVSPQPVRANIPESVRVRFPNSRLNPDPSGGSPWYVVDVGGGPDGAEPDTLATLTDDLPALYDSGGVLTNTTALATRAAERAADYFRRANLARLYRVYEAPRSLTPGSLLASVTHQDRGQGYYTEAGRLDHIGDLTPAMNASAGAAQFVNLSVTNLTVNQITVNNISVTEILTLPPGSSTLATPGHCSPAGTLYYYADAEVPANSRLWLSLGSDTAGDCPWVAFCPCDSVTLGGSAGVTGCCSCAAMPAQWTVTVAGFTNGECADCTNLNGTFTLSYSFGGGGICFWDSPTFALCGDGANYWRLDCDGTDFNLFAKLGNSPLYSKSMATFNCLGANVMTKQPSVGCTAGAPATLTITPV